MNDSSTLGAELSFGDVDQVRRVLLIEDDEDDYLLTRDYFDDFEKSDQHTLEWVDEYDEGLKVLLEESHDVCLLDFRLGARDGLELLREAHEKGCRTPIILLTGAGSRRIDTSAMRHGAADYLVKDDLTPALLERSIRHAIERHRFSEAQRFLAATGVQLTSTLDYEETLEGLARLVVEHLADYCAIDLIDEDGRPTRLEVGVGANGSEEMGAWLREHRFCENPDCTAALAIARGDAVLVHRIDEEFLGEVSQTEAHRDALRRMQPVSLMAVPLKARGEQLGTVVFVSTDQSRTFDNSDLALAEQLAFRAGLAVDNALLYREAKRAVEMRDEVHRIVVHDLRNPLSTIDLTAQHMERRLDKGEDLEKLRDYLDTQRKATERMNRLIEDLLTVARIEEGQLSLNRRPYPPAMLVEQVVSQHQVQAEDKELTIESSLPDELPRIVADAARIEQLLSNLVGNALKFTLPGGHIEVGARAKDDEVLFWVEDTGVGMSPEQLPRLFDSFWQAEQGARHGAGLGLAIARGIVEGHDGEIWVESEEGVGTTFYFTVPVA